VELAEPPGPPPAPPPPPPPPPPAPRTIADSPHVMLGIPKDGDDSDDYLLDKGELVISYNAKSNVANWVAWRLVKDDLGKAPRSPGFHSDTDLPKDFYVVKDDDYKGSGYDRGHLCPSADRTSSAAANLATFVFTNVHPQAHELNAGPWEELEKHERELARAGKDLYIVAGGVFGGSMRKIGHDVAVPTWSYKIIVILEHGQTLADVRPDTPSIAVMMMNSRAAKDRVWVDYVKTIREIEYATHYDYDTRISSETQEKLETKR
jgi:endonuclease G